MAFPGGASGSGYGGGRGGACASGGMGGYGYPHQNVLEGDLNPPPIIPPSAPNGEAGPDAEVLKTNVFKYWFTKGPPDANKVCIVKCRFCSTKYKHLMGSGYGNYHKHTKAKRPDKYGIGTNQTQLTGFANTSNRPPLFHYDYASSSNAFAEMLSVDHLSFRFAESVGLNTWVSENLQPTHKSISRKTVKRRTMDIYKERKKQMCQYFMDHYDLHVSICSDIWSDHWQTHSYMGITCHCIYEDTFTMHKRVLVYRVFGEAHTGQNIARMIINVLHEYN